MQKEIINSAAAPAPIGPYNHAVKFGDILFVSGQIPFNQAKNEMVNSGIQDETRQCLENVKAILSEAGYGLEHVLKASIFISDMEQFSLINEVYATYFTENEPARECVQVAKLPRNVNIEISVIAGK